jgi:ribosomal protein L29
MKKKKLNIKCMSYQERQNHYEQEKNELFYKIASLSAEEVQKARRELVEKWGV